MLYRTSYQFFYITLTDTEMSYVAEPTQSDMHLLFVCIKKNILLGW